MTIFTICSNNYLAQAIVLGNSIKVYNPEYNFKIFLCDEKSEDIDYKQIPHNIIEIKTIEPEINDLAKKYNIIELNTAVKPTVFQQLFKKEDIQKAIYLDPDIVTYSSLDILSKLLDDNSIILTPHITNPLPWDGKSPNENLFLNYGIYNLGFIGLRNDVNSDNLLTWWKNHTYINGYKKPHHGVFVDQLPINLSPIFFDGVFVSRNMGLNMAPWNLHERQLNPTDRGYEVNYADDLIFFHFSSFNVSNLELPLQYYNRYLLKDREDLSALYEGYKEELLANGYHKYSTSICCYVDIYEEELIKLKQMEWNNFSTLKKIFVTLKNIIPNRIKKKLR